MYNISWSHLPPFPNTFRLVGVGRLSLNVGGTIPWAAALDCVSVDSELSTNIHCGCSVSSWLKLLSPRLLPCWAVTSPWGVFKKNSPWQCPDLNCSNLRWPPAPLSCTSLGKFSGPVKPESLLGAISPSRGSGNSLAGVLLSCLVRAPSKYLVKHDSLS